MSQQINYDNTGWQNIDITSLVQKWYKNDSQDKNLLRLYVECSGCGSRRLIVHPFSSMINHHQQKQQKIKREKVEIDKSNRPYLAVHIEPATLKRMKRRALDCSVASKSQCCKQRFYVSFKALGWDDWIIAPPGYYANYCSGKCGNGLNRSPDTFPTYYSHVVHEVRKYNKLNGNQLCCAPLKFSSMSLIYFGPDSKIIRRDLPKMVVDECGCP
jgi:inhibin beta B chain